MLNFKYRPIKTLALSVLIVFGLCSNLGRSLTTSSKKISRSPNSTSSLLELVPSDELDCIWTKISGDLKKAKWAQGPMNILIEDTFNSLRGHAIFYITPEVKEAYDLNNSHNLIPYAFYVPKTDEIFIQRNLDDDTYERALLHELVHAFQYRVRYPSDVIRALAAKEKWTVKGQVMPTEVMPPKNEELPGILDFYYEAQAHWYALAVGTNPEWNQYWDDESKVDLRTTTFDENDEDNFMFARDLETLHILFESSTPYKIPAIYDAKFGRNLGSSFSQNLVHNSRFQSHFISQMIKTYYEDQSYVYSNRRSAANLHVILTDQFDEKIKDLNASRLSVCRELIKTLFDSRLTSPALFWKDPNRISELKKCKLYDGIDVKLLQEFNKLEEQFPPHSPFRKIKPGGEGTHGDFSVHSSIKIQPQLEVRP